jgi:hypothetical protein
MKHPILTCYRTCPIHYIGIFLSFIVEVMVIPLFLISNTPLAILAAIAMIYILYAQIKFSTDIVEKCHFIVEASKRPTGLYYKNGTERYYYTDYPFMTIIMLVIPAMIIGAYIMASLIAI